jgi:hypothetical protein
MKIYYYLHGIMHAQKLFTLVLLVNTCTNDLHNLQIKVSMKFMYTRVGLMTLAIQV